MIESHMREMGSGNGWQGCKQRMGGKAMSEERFYTIRPRRRPVADSDGNEWPSVRDAALAVSGAVSAESCISHACRTGGTYRGRKWRYVDEGGADK